MAIRCKYIISNFKPLGNLLCRSSSRSAHTSCFSLYLIWPQTPRHVSDSGSRPNPKGVLELLVFLGAQHWWSQNFPDRGSRFPEAVALAWEQELGTLLPFKAPCPGWAAGGLVSYLHAQLTGFCAGNFDRHWLLACFVACSASISIHAELRLHFAVHHCPALHSHAGSIHIKLMILCLKEDQEKLQSDKRQKADRQFGSLIKINCKPM